MIVIDLKPLNYNCTANYATLISDFVQDYPNACEDPGDQLTQAFGPWLEITIIVDSDHTYDLETCCSLTGLIDLFGSTLALLFNHK